MRDESQKMNLCPKHSSVETNRFGEAVRESYPPFHQRSRGWGVVVAVEDVRTVDVDDHCAARNVDVACGTDFPVEADATRDPPAVAV